MTKKKTTPVPKTATPTKAPARSVAVSVDDARAAQERQLAAFNEAVKLFSKRDFAAALRQFQEAAAGPAANVADKARSYAQVCERRTNAGTPPLRTAEDYFTYGVERLNARDIEQARSHLERALELAPQGDHIIYALALCYGLAGDGAGAYENLKRAIEMEPGNRILARQDPEFSALAQQIPTLRSLLGSNPPAA